MKNKVFIFEGAQGVGKSTVTRLMREQIPYTPLISLTGTSDKSKTGESKVFMEHFAVLGAIDNCSGCDLNFILDRSFISEKVYCNLGFKDYTFNKNYKALLNYLSHLADSYDIYIIHLVASRVELTKRLNRNKPEFLNVKFSADNSIRQQDEYRSLIRAIKRDYPNINCVEVHTDNQDPYDIIYDIKEGAF